MKSSLSWKHVICVMVFAAIILVSFRAAIHHLDPVTAVELGMTADNVTHLMGAPQSTSNKDKSIVYTFPKAKVYFQDGKVVAIVTEAK